MVPPALSSRPTTTAANKTMEVRLNRANDLAEQVTQWSAELQTPLDAKVVQELVNLHKLLKNDYVKIRQDLLNVNTEIRQRREVHTQYDKLMAMDRTLAAEWEEKLSSRNSSQWTMKSKVSCRIIIIIVIKFINYFFRDEPLLISVLNKLLESQNYITNSGREPSPLRQHIINPCKKRPHHRVSRCLKL